MKRTCLLLGLAVLCGCRHYDRTPIAAYDPGPPMRDVTPAPVKDTPLASAPTPAKVDPETSIADSAPSTELAHRPTVAEAVDSVNGRLEDVFFAYDRFDLTPEGAAALRRDAELLRALLRDFPALQISVEGHCDERGSAEYSLGLGDRRATRVAGSLAGTDLPRASFAAVSYGKEKPQCTEAAESCWSRNRRVHFVVRSNATN